ncbi:hypothetical protein KP509_37G067900 [Ceratopteris richardii]|nr:hypothetical protein KP509_37G067900 [Ceratopteris richardii]
MCKDGLPQHKHEIDQKTSQQHGVPEIKEVGLTTAIGQKESAGSIPVSPEKPSPSAGEETCSSLPCGGGETSEGGDENKEKMPNGRQELKSERPQKVSRSAEQQLISAKTSQDNLSPKAGDRNDSANLSSDKKPTGDEHGKALGNDKCVGAKKRKQGFVRRVRQGLDSHDSEEKVAAADDKSEDVKEATNTSKVAGSTKTRPLSPPKAVAAQEPKSPSISAQGVPPLTKILKAVNYNSLCVDGKQDVTVVFKVSRADGEEVFVDNKYMKANYPILLIEFYEKHLRYSSTNSSIN